MAAILEAEGQFAAGITEQAVRLCIEQHDLERTDVRRVADLGCGPGVATARLAEEFERAAVVGVDGSSVMLERAADRAARHGMPGRVELRSLDLNDDLRALGTFDLVWSALALHHTADEQAALGNFAALLNRRGLLCLLERADPMALHPTHDLGRPGIWGRVEVAQRTWHERIRGSVPGVADASAYGEMLQHAGLELLDSRTLTDTAATPVEPALYPVITRYVRAALRNLREALDPADAEALADAAARVADIAWGDALVTSTRTLFIARAAGSHS